MEGKAVISLPAAGFDVTYKDFTAAGVVHQIFTTITTFNTSTMPRGFILNASVAMYIGDISTMSTSGSAFPIAANTPLSLPAITDDLWMYATATGTVTVILLTDAWNSY